MIGILAVTLTSIVLIVAGRYHGHTTNLGCMSERWLEEQRASHP
jgi:hypothetical protein